MKVAMQEYPQRWYQMIRCPPLQPSLDVEIVEETWCLWVAQSRALERLSMPFVEEHGDLQVECCVAWTLSARILTQLPWFGIDPPSGLRLILIQSQNPSSALARRLAVQYRVDSVP